MGTVAETPAVHKEFEYYLANQNELVRKYSGRFVVIKGEGVIGVYDDTQTAIAESAKKYTLGEEETRAIFHSRVA